MRGGEKFMADTTRRTVLGIFDTRAHADSALSALEGMGYSTKDVSVIARDTSVGGGTTVVADDDHTGPVEGAAAGATTGGVIGGIAGLLVGLGALTIPGIGALFITGPIAAALGLTGAAAATASGAMTGALAGGLIGALTNLGVDEETAKVYEERVKAGGILLAAPVIDNVAEEDVKSAFEDNEAAEVHVV